MSGIAVYAVVYPAAMRFFGEFWSSLAPQLIEGFELCLSLDGVTEDEVWAVTGPEQRLRLAPVTSGSNGHWPTPAEIRDKDLAGLAKEFYAVVLLDSDDIVLPGRLEAARNALSEHDVYACALEIVGEDARPLQVPDFALDDSELHELNRGALLADVNAFGFSNSAYRSEILRQCLEVPSQTVLMDWLVASRAHLIGASFTFDAVPRMQYRQYGNNTAKVIPPFTADRVLADTRRVIEHYGLLLDAAHGAGRSVTPFERARERADRLIRWFGAPGAASGVTNLMEYVARLNAMPKKTYLWWQHLTLEVPELGYAAGDSEREDTRTV